MTFPSYNPQHNITKNIFLEKTKRKKSCLENRFQILMNQPKKKVYASFSLFPPICA